MKRNAISTMNRLLPSNANSDGRLGIFADAASKFSLG
jgi:hypothetical protein